MLVPFKVITCDCDSVEALFKKVNKLPVQILYSFSGTPTTGIWLKTVINGSNPGIPVIGNGADCSSGTRAWTTPSGFGEFESEDRYPN